ncbi:MAG: hypothetical protein AB8B97_24490 [Granulosicoccus sp.]
MILNQSIDCTVRDRLCALYRRVTLLCIVLALGACSGGGLGGSGDGGGIGDDRSLVPLPDTFEPAYQFRHVPERLLAQFPSSLSSDQPAVEPADATPLNMLTSSVEHLLDSKLEIGLLQLRIEAGWLQVMEHCSATSVDSGCDLQGANISTPYSAAMASWEFLLRAGIYLERFGGNGNLPDETRADIMEQVSNKIGTVVSIDSGMFTKRSSGGYRYEIVMTTDLGFGETLYTTRWSEGKDLTFVSLVDVTNSVVENLQSSTNSGEASGGFSNAILMTTFDNGSRQERQLNLNQPDKLGELRIESNVTHIQDGSKTDYYSIGNADASGGYLSSEQTFEDAADTKVSDFIRESFTEYATIETQSICRMASSETQCNDEDRWDILTSQDPVLSQFFLSPSQLIELENRLMPFSLDIQGVSPELDTLLLIRRENLAISFSAEGVTVTLPGLGTFNLSDNSVTPDTDTDTDTDTENSEQFSEYADSVLCRVNTATIDNQTQYRSFCAGTKEEIEQALVIGESFREGKLVIEWQANAVVEFVEN